MVLWFPRTYLSLCHTAAHLKHAAVGPEGVNGEVHPRPNHLRNLLRAGRPWLVGPAEAKGGHAVPAELGIDVRVRGDGGDVLLPLGEALQPGDIGVKTQPSEKGRQQAVVCSPHGRCDGWPAPGEGAGVADAVALAAATDRRLDLGVLRTQTLREHKHAAKPHRPPPMEK